MRRAAAAWLTLAALASGLAAPSAGSSEGPGQARIDTFGRGSWCWFADPRAVHVRAPYDETFAGWIDWHGRVTVGSYDQRFGVTRTHVVGHLFHDDHGSPAILVEPDHRLTLFWSGHNGGSMYYRSTLRPEAIGAWGPTRKVLSKLPGRDGFTYPNPVIVPAENERLYLFWRGADWSQDYATRAVSGRWSPARRLISVPHERPYVKVDSNGRNEIVFAFTNGHPRTTTTSVYYAAYRDGWLRNARGRRIARLGAGPIRPREASVVYDGAARGVSGWVWDVALDARGRPVIVYATFRSERDHHYWYARWNGVRWARHFITSAGPSISPRTIEQQYSGGIALDHSDPSVLYLSRRVRGRFEIERWSTPDGGASWKHVTVVRTPGAGDVRPVVPRGSDPGSIQLLWLQGPYRSYSTYRTSIGFLR